MRGVADSVAIISVVASSTVALAAVGAQMWQGRLNRESERRAWLRDRQANAYIAILRLFVKTPDQVTQDEWEQLTASTRAFASPRIFDLYAQWGTASRTTWEPGVAEEARGKAYDDAERLQEELGAAIASELQGTRVVRG